MMEFEILMRDTVRPDIPFLAQSGTVLWFDYTYKAKANQNGAVSGQCNNGEWLGVKPGEFVFVGGVPAWLYDLWTEKYPESTFYAERVAEEGDVD